MRHNLSSNRAFKKAERGPDERGKGALWTVDPQHEHTFEEQEAKRQNLAALGTTGGKDGKAPSKKGKGTPSSIVSLKPSIHCHPKGAPLPPPLTSVPLVPKAKAALNTSTVTNLTATLAVHPPIKQEPNAYTPSLTPRPTAASSSTSISTTPVPAINGSPSIPASRSTQAPSAFPAIPASVRLPIIVGPVPGSSTSPPDPASPPKPIVLHENTLVLNPEIFSHLTPQHLKDLEVLGAQKALEILQSYIVRFYKEKLKAESGRGRGRGKVRRGRGGPPGAARPSPSGAGRGDGTTTALFTTAPLPPRPSVSPPQPASDKTAPPHVAPSSVPPMASLQPTMEDSNEEINVVDDDPVEEEPVPKKRRVDCPTPQA